MEPPSGLGWRVRRVARHRLEARLDPALCETTGFEPCERQQVTSPVHPRSSQTTRFQKGSLPTNLTTQTLHNFLRILKYTR